MGVLSITLKGDEISTPEFQVKLRRSYRLKHFKLLHAYYNITSKNFATIADKTTQRLLFMKMKFLGAESIENITENKSLISLGLSSHSTLAEGTIMSRDLYKVLVSGKVDVIQADLHFTFYYLDSSAEVKQLTLADINNNAVEKTFINLVFEFDE